MKAHLKFLSSSWSAVPILCSSLLFTLTLRAAAVAANNNVNNASTMQTQNHYTTSFLVDQTPQEVFDAISHVRGWWSGEIAGSADKLDAEFTYRVPNIHYSSQKVTEWVPGERIVWHVLDAELTFVKDKREWKGTDIVFEIAKKDRKTEVRFTHRGLIPTFECYDKCSNAWGALVNGNLRRWIVTGEVQPSPWEPQPAQAPAGTAGPGAVQE